MAFAADTNSLLGKINRRSQYQRVGGTFVVSDISKKPDGTFVVEFKSDHPTGRIATVHLESDHVHFAVDVGSKLRISAEILSVNGNIAEASQVLVFIPSRQGHTPVWLLSKRASRFELNGAKLIEMHAPQSDFQIL